MDFKLLFSGLLTKVKQFFIDQHFTFDQLFYFTLIIIEKLFGILNLPWLLVGLIPLVPPTYFRMALTWAAGLFKTALSKLKTK